VCARVPPDHRRSGRRGELVGVVLMLACGYRILARNLRTPYGEIDIVCRRGDALVLVEVKRRRTRRFGSAAHAVTPRQEERLVRAMVYLRGRMRWARRARIDLVAIDGWRVRIVRDAVAYAERAPASMRGWA